MPLFVTYASFASGAMKDFISKPTDRADAVGSLIEKAGGKLIAIYFTTGSNDVIVISEGPDVSMAAAVSMAVGSSGAMSGIETVNAWTSADAVSVAQKAGQLAGTYTPPGQG